MTRTALAYHVRPYVSADRPAVLRLLEQSLAGGPTGHRTDEFFAWKHEQNPFGPSVALVADDGDQIIGFRTFMRWRFVAGGRAVHAMRAVDTATAPDHQGRGIFTRLTLAALDRVRAEGIHLIFNTPNERSLPGYRRMGWSVVGRVPIALRPVRPIRFLRGVRAAAGPPVAGPVPRCSLPPVGEALSDTGAVAELLGATSDGEHLRTDRSIAYLQWRYARAAGLGYRAITVRQGSSLLGLAIGRPRQRGRLREFTLSDVVVRPGDRRTAARLLRAVAKAGTDHVATHLTPGTALRSAGHRSGYLGVPGQGMTLVANPLRSITPHPLALQSWRLSLGDLEVF